MQTVCVKFVVKKKKEKKKHTNARTVSLVISEIFDKIVVPDLPTLSLLLVCTLFDTRLLLKKTASGCQLPRRASSKLFDKM